MSSGGYFILDANKGSILKSITSKSPFFSKEQVASLPSTKNKFFEIIPAVVVDVYLGNSKGKIKVKKLIGGDGTFEAYPLFSNIRKLPLIGETVLVSEYLPIEIGASSRLARFRIEDVEYTNLFYHTILNTQNSVSINKNYEYFDSNDRTKLNEKKDKVVLNFRDNLPDKPTISEYFINNKSKTLFPLEGDFILEGRSGCSIRFSQSIKKNIIFTSYLGELLGANYGSNEQKAKKNEVWIYGEQGGKPIIVISNGRELTDKVDFDDSLEDINKDDCSIYLSSDNYIPLLASAFNSSQLIRDKKEVKKFYGKQIILNSDRIVLNSKKNELLFYSKKYISFSSTDEIYNKSSKFLVDSSVVELGDNAKKSGSPVAKANAVVSILEELISLIQTSVTMNNPASIAKFQLLMSRLHEIKSDISFTN